MPEERESKPRPVNYKRIPETDQNGRKTRWYEEMEKLIGEYHPSLVEFKIALVWRKAWKPDKDGRLILGQALKVSPEATQFHGYHGYIRLNEEWYHTVGVGEQEKIAVLDHELCHFEREVDKNDDTKKDEDGQPIIRMVKHDLEEFVAIVDRYGLYTDCLRQMAGTMYNARERERARTPRSEPNA